MSTDQRRHQRRDTDEDEAKLSARSDRTQKSSAGALDDALDDSFPASDPPSMTQPHTHVGAPLRNENRAAQEVRSRLEWVSSDWDAAQERI